MFKRYQQIHFVGIGGAGMSGIAEILLNLGYRVTGSDHRRNEAVERLEQLGAKIFVGHAPSHIEGAHVVVYSSAVSRENIEVQVARQRQIPTIPRAEMLAEMMRLKYGIAVGGTHGKTTTTSMIGAVLAEGRYDPTIVVGGRVTNLGSNARLGQGDYLVAEADESDGSFLKLAPTIAVVTTVDAEHLDHYGTLEAIREAFVQFVNKVPFYGSAVLCLDQPNIQMLIPRIEKRIITYGLESGGDLVARRLSLSGMTSRFEVFQRGSLLGECTLQLPGRHNVLNALAAIGVGLELEIPFVTAQRALAGFAGVQRRFQIRGRVAGGTGVDDYGHRPAGRSRADARCGRRGLTRARAAETARSRRSEREGAMLGEIRGEVRFKEPLSFHTSLRIGGPADIFVVPQDVDDIRHALLFAEREQLSVAVIGGGNNLLVRDRGVRGVGLRLEGGPAGAVLIGCRLRLTRRPLTEVQKDIKVRLKQKKATQPLALASAGCVWKNPRADVAGRLIEKCGLKGKRINGAEISSKHANFIVNRGGATAADILALMDLTRDRVQHQFGIALEPEIRILGE